MNVEASELFNIRVTWKENRFSATIIISRDKFMFIYVNNNQSDWQYISHLLASHMQLHSANVHFTSNVYDELHVYMYDFMNANMYECMQRRMDETMDGKIYGNMHGNIEGKENGNMCGNIDGELNVKIYEI